MEITEYQKQYDALKTKILKYALYKKRTEQEIREKFSEYAGNMFEDVIEYLKQENYIDDNSYIQKAVKEFIILKNLSIKELTYKLYSKGLSKDLVDDYIYENKEEMLEYEIKSATNIINKKKLTLEYEEIKEYLLKKGYMIETLKIIEENN